MASNLSVGSSVVVNRPSTGSPDPRQLPFGSGHQAPVSGRLCGTISGGADHHVPVSRCLSTTGIRFSGHPSPAEEFNLPHGRPTRPAGLDLDGIVTFRTSKMRSDWAPPSTPGRRCSPGLIVPLASACRFSTASPAHPATTSHLRGSTMTRRRRGFTHVRPPDLPLACGPRMEREPLGLEPRAPHPMRLIQASE
jgi:hypothetical protein